MIGRRLSFGLLFLLGTAAAALGWTDLTIVGIRLGFLTIVGHTLQVIGIFGAMLVPDKIVELTPEEIDEMRDDIL